MRLRLIGILAFFVCAACNPFASDRSLSAFGGRLVGTDRGEFGGELVFRARDGSIQSVLKDNVQGIFKMPFGVVVFTGLDHLTTRGAMYSLSLGADEKVEARLMHNLQGKPSDFVRQRDGSLRFRVPAGELRFGEYFYKCATLDTRATLQVSDCP